MPDVVIQPRRFDCGFEPVAGFMNFVFQGFQKLLSVPHACVRDQSRAALADSRRMWTMGMAAAESEDHSERKSFGPLR